MKLEEGSTHMRTLLTLAAMVGALVSAPAFATKTYDNGNELFANCSAKGDNLVSAFKTGLCDGYVIGVADALADGANINGFTACPTGSVAKKQMYDIVLRYLTQHPEMRHYGAVGLVAAAISDAFPCRDKQ
jgi:hypothetical protein